MRKASVFNYKSIFAGGIIRSISLYNFLHPDRSFSVDMLTVDRLCKESLMYPADIFVHSGGDGIPVEEDIEGVPRLYICYSHQWKAKSEGGRVIRLDQRITGLRYIDILQDDDVLGRRGKAPIMQYHEYAVVIAPRDAKVLATSKAVDEDGREVEIIEALR